jgi:FtsP/CotA-like multicopper oxidase with cupredoxin domain
MNLRRELLKFSVLAALPRMAPSVAESLSTPDYKLEISAVTLELSPRRRLKTTAYNGQAPGPVLRLREGKAVTIEVTNHTDRPEVVHWHGLFMPSEIDGATEEGTPYIPSNGTVRYTFTPRPAGFRWYHTHAMAMGDLTRGQYSGQHGFLFIEPRDDPGQYDQEFFLCLHDWYGYLRSGDDGAMSTAYAVSTVNGKTLGHGEPLRVREGERILLHVLNSSPTDVHWISMSGHDLQVVALDGNAVPMPRTVSMLRLAPAERASVIVQLNNPGVWVLGEVRQHVQTAGMGIVVEYAGRGGTPRWLQPPELTWTYQQFARPETDRALDASQTPSVLMPLVFESVFRGHGAMERYTINGKSYPETDVVPLKQGMRYRLQFINKTADDHPVHLHRHSFELRSLGAALGMPAGTPPITGLKKDVLLVEAHTQAEVEFTANNPGATLFHCHQQDHMDMGFMMLFNYV